MMVYLTYGCTRFCIEAPSIDEAVAAFKEDFPDKEPKITQNERTT